jgi:hypothetical protein
VDFVVYGAGTFAALEVKRSRNVQTRDLQGLKAFRADYPEASVALLHLGSEPLRIEGIACLPLEGFLRDLVPTAPGRGSPLMVQ